MSDLTGILVEDGMAKMPVLVEVDIRGVAQGLSGDPADVLEKLEEIIYAIQGHVNEEAEQALEMAAAAIQDAMSLVEE